MPRQTSLGIGVCHLPCTFINSLLDSTEEYMSTQLEKEPVRRPVAVILVLLCLVALGSGAWYYTHRTKAPENASTTPAALGEQHRKTEAVPAPASTEQSPANVASSTATPTMPATVATRAETSRRPEPSAESRQLVKNLLQIDFSKGPITAEQAASWKTQVTNLVQAGATAVPAIREFLEQNKDLAFD